ncbi:MAG: hypothetical protein PVF34_06080 [Gammaproteobacteria bacterium]|jgi:hypothetical protein
MNDINDNPKSGFQVGPSPLNAVKLELAIIIVIGLVFWIALDSITSNDVAQIGLLFLFGIVSAAWLVLRTRHLARRAAKSHNE